MRFLHVSVFVMVLCLVFLPLSAGDSGADDFYVESDGDDANGGESSSDAWATIQYAIDHDEVDEGDTIYVGEGTFTEALVIDKGVTLYGEGSDTVIQGDDSDTTVLTISADDVTLEFFAVEGDADANDYGIYVSEGVDDLTIYNCDISGVDTGIYLDDTDSADIAYCDVDDNATGIYLTDATNATIADNDFTDNSTGIRIVESDIDSIYDNDFDGGSYGIYLVYSGEEYYFSEDADDLEADNSFDDCEEANVYLEEKDVGCFIRSLL
jgi:parallel beta-helix repeat protein